MASSAAVELRRSWGWCRLSGKKRGKLHGATHSGDSPCPSFQFSSSMSRYMEGFHFKKDGFHHELWQKRCETMRSCQAVNAMALILGGRATRLYHAARLGRGLDET